MANLNSRSYPKGLKEIRYPSEDIIHRYTSKDYTGYIKLNNQTGEFEFNPPLRDGGFFQVKQEMHGFAKRQALYHDGTQFILANSELDNTLGVWIVTDVPNINNFTCTQLGRVEDSEHGMTPGHFYFVSDVDGELTIDEPEINSNPLVFVESDSYYHVLPYRPSSTVGEEDTPSFGAGTSFEVVQPGHGFAVRQPLFHNGTEFELAVATADDTLGVWLVTNILDSDRFVASLSGRFSELGHGMTPGQFYYVDETPGTMTNVEPETYSNPLIYVESSSYYHVLPYRPSITVGGDAGGGGDVTSVFGRTGTVVAQSGDYTKDQVGLDNVDNTADADKPVSLPVQNALDDKADQIELDNHTGDTSNPHSVTADQVGLGEVDNTADADKPVSLPVQNALDDKADQLELDNHVDNTSNPHSVTTAQLGLDQVDNTSDINKPISTATQTALNVKLEDSLLDGNTYGRNNGAWVSIPGAQPAPIDSVFGRTGDVVAESGDYASHYAPLVHNHTESQITDLDKYTQSEVDSAIENLQITNTGVLTGGLITHTGVNQFTIEAGTGLVIDASDSTNITTTDVSWSEQTNVALTVAGTPSTTYVFFDVTGTVQQSPIWTTSMARDNIYIGYVSSTDTDIIAISARPAYSRDTSSAVVDIAILLNGTIMQGVDLYPVGSAGNELKIGSTSGLVFQFSSNYFTDPKNPNYVLYQGGEPMPYQYLTSTGHTYGGVETDINPMIWDNAGTVEAITGADSNATILSVYSQGGNAFVLPGQIIYDSLSEAVADISDYFSKRVEPANLESSVFIGYIVVAKGCTDLTDPSCCQIYTPTRFWDNTVDNTFSLEGDDNPTLASNLITNSNALKFTQLENTGVINDQIEYGDIALDNNDIKISAENNIQLDSNFLILPNAADKAGTFLTVGSGGLVTYTTLNESANSWEDTVANIITVPDTSENAVYNLNIDEEVTAGSLEYQVNLSLPWYRNVSVRLYVGATLIDTQTYSGAGSPSIGGSFPITSTIANGTAFTVTVQADVSDYTVVDTGFLKVIKSGSSATAEWGGVTGNIVDQTDLQLELDGKANTAHTHVEANITDLDKYTQQEVDDALDLKVDKTYLKGRVFTGNVITVDPSDPEADFNDLAAAVNSVTDNSATNRYTFLLSPGIYTLTAPLQLKDWTTIDTLGDIQTTRVEQLTPNTDIFLGADYALVNNITMFGVTGTGACLNMSTSGTAYLRNCAFTDSSIGILQDHVDSNIAVYHSTTAQTTDPSGVIFDCRAGHLDVNGFNLVEDTTVDTIIKSDGVNANVHCVNVHSESPNVNYGFQILGGSNVNEKGSYIKGADIAIYLNGTNSEGTFTGTTLLDSVICGIRIDAASVDCRLGGISYIIESQTGNNLEILSDTATLYGSGVTDLRKVTSSQGANIIATVVDLDDNDKGTNILGELHVGTPLNPAESCLGGGDSYTRGMLAFEDVGGTFTNIYDNVSDSTQTYTMANSNNDNAIYLASAIPANGDTAKISGFKVEVSTAVTLGTGNFVIEYWDGAAWQPTNFMVAESSGDYYPLAKQLFETVGSFHIRYDSDLVNKTWVANDPMTLGQDFYWTRIRFENTVTSPPSIDLFKVHSDRTEINASGWIEFFGDARPTATIPWDAGLLQAANNSPVNADIYLSDNLGVGRIENSFVNGATDRVGFVTALPSELDTSTPINFKWSVFSTSGGGDVQWIVRWAYSSEGSNVYNSTASAPTTAPTEQQTILIEAGPTTLNEEKWYEVDLDVSDMVSRRDGGQPDSLWLTLERTGGAAADTHNGNVNLIALNPVYTKWNAGGHK